MGKLAISPANGQAIRRALRMHYLSCDASWHEESGIVTLWGAMPDGTPGAVIRFVPEPGDVDGNGRGWRYTADGGADTGTVESLADALAAAKRATARIRDARVAGEVAGAVGRVKLARTRERSAAAIDVGRIWCAACAGWQHFTLSGPETDGGEPCATCQSCEATYTATECADAPPHDAPPPDGYRVGDTAPLSYLLDASPARVSASSNGAHTIRPWQEPIRALPESAGVAFVMPPGAGKFAVDMEILRPLDGAAETVPLARPLDGAAVPLVPAPTAHALGAFVDTAPDTAHLTRAALLKMASEFDELSRAARAAGRKDPMRPCGACAALVPRNRAKCPICHAATGVVIKASST